MGIIEIESIFKKRDIVIIQRFASHGVYIIRIKSSLNHVDTDVLKIKILQHMGEYQV